MLSLAPYPWPLILPPLILPLILPYPCSYPCLSLAPYPVAPYPVRRNQVRPHKERHVCASTNSRPQSRLGPRAPAGGLSTAAARTAPGSASLRRRQQSLATRRPEEQALLGQGARSLGGASNPGLSEPFVSVSAVTRPAMSSSFTKSARSAPLHVGTLLEPTVSVHVWAPITALASQAGAGTR